MDLTPRQFLDAVTTFVETPTTEAPVKSQERPNKIGTIDPAYVSGRAKVTFDGESTMSTKTYSYLSPYTPVAGHRVVLLPVGTSYVILGRLLP